MRTSGFSDDQIIVILEEHSASIQRVYLCRKLGISQATFYTWRTRFGRSEVSYAKKFKALEEKNRKLKKQLP